MSRTSAWCGRPYYMHGGTKSPRKAARSRTRVLPQVVSELTVVVYVTDRVVVGMESVFGRISGHTVDVLPLLLAGRVAEVVRSALGLDILRHPLPCDLAELLLHGKRVGALDIVDAGELLLDNLVQQNNLCECQYVALRRFRGLLIGLHRSLSTQACVPDLSLPWSMSGDGLSWSNPLAGSLSTFF